MNRNVTTPRVKKNVLIAFLALLLAVSGLLSVRNGASHMAAAVVTESPKAPTEKTEKMPEVKKAIIEAPAKTLETPALTTIGSGEASFYGPGFAGRPTANGERFNPAEMTAAHRTLPFGTKLKVTNERNGRSVVVRINDRGPYAHNRVIDLSKGAAEKIGMISSGTAQVKLEKIS